MAATAVSFFVLFSLIFHPVFLHPIEPGDDLFEYCRPFNCGNLGLISFPFTKKTKDPRCGHFVLAGCDEEHPHLKIKPYDRESEIRYQIDSITSTVVEAKDVVIINATDTELQQSLNSRSCTSFHDSGFLGWGYDGTLSKLNTLYKCGKAVNTTSAHFEKKYTKCHDFNIFYYNNLDERPKLIEGCSIITLPANISNIGPQYNEDIFESLIASISLQVSVRPLLGPPCNDCEHNQGECKQNTTSKIRQCIYPNGTSTELEWKDQLESHENTMSVRPLLGPPCDDCEHKGGKCKQNSATKIWQCIYPNGTSTELEWKDQLESHENKGLGLKQKLLIGFGCLAGLTILMLLAFFWRRHNKKRASSNHLPRNTYSASFSKSDLEGANIYYGVSIFTYTQLEEATNNFASENELGDGGFGTVYYGKLQDGREVAVKRLYERNYRKVNQFLNEIDILTRLRHQNLVSLYGCTSRRSRELLLVYEYIPNGTVADHLHGDRAFSSPLSWPIRMRIAIETANALVYLHASGIIHRDVKTNNILLDNNFCVKVADFGISRLFPIDVTHISTAPQGTPGYVDPEYRQCYQLTEKSDVYSFGVVLVELISSLPPVDITRNRQEINLANLAINKIQKCAFDELLDPFLGYETDDEVKRMTTLVAELAFLCLQQDKETRPSMEEVLEELKRIENGEYESDILEDEEHGHN